MGWNQWYAAKSYVRASIWIVPLMALAVEQISIRLVTAFDTHVEWIPMIGATAGGTIGELDTVVTLAMSFIVFTFGSILVAIQVASGQLTPRIIATTLLRDNVIRATVGLFVFTLLFATGVKARSDDKILLLGGTISVLLGIGSIMAFLFLIDYAARLLRSGFNRLAHWRAGDSRYRICLSGCDQGTACSHPETQETWSCHAHDRAPWKLCNHTRCEPRGYRRSCSEGGRRHRVCA